MKRFAFALLACAPPQPAAAQDVDPRVSELHRALIAVHSVDSRDRDYSDLRALEPALDGVRVLFIGEPSHGDGTAFLARGRLIEFLHRELGFNTLAFESGMFSVRRGLADATSPADVAAGALSSIFAIWSQSEQAAPAIRYAAATAGTAHPLRIVGMNAQLSRRDTVLLPRLDAYLRTHAAASLTAWQTVHELLLLLSTSVFEPVAMERREEFRTAVSTLRAALHDLDEAEARGWALFLDNASAFVETAWRRDMAPRETQMADNLLHLLENEPGSRIIVWIASVYAVDRGALTEPDGTPLYPGEESAARQLRQRIGSDAVYSLVFTASGGTYGTWSWREPSRPLEPPQPGSLEALFAATRLSYGILDLRGAARSLPHWLDEPLIARPLGYTPMRARWADAADGVFLIREMAPSTREPR